MIRLRPDPDRNRPDQDEPSPAVRDVFARFFDLIARIERRSPRPEHRSAPEIKARITRLDAKSPRAL